MKIIKFITILFLIFLFSGKNSVSAQTPDPVKVYYHPEEDAKAEVASAVAEANAQHKHVLIMVGGNWCRWCKMFMKFVETNDPVDSALNAGFIIAHVNYSKENKNLPLLAEWGYPQRFGFPVFVILDGDGHRLHTQNSSYLEQGEGYSKEKTIEFFNQWSPGAFDPEKYK